MNLKQAGWIGILLMCMQLCKAVNITLDATVGIFLQKELLVQGFTSSPSDPVKFIASTSGSPDLPTWLRFEQREASDRAFIYGTPGHGVPSQVVLEVTAWNKTDYTTKRQDVVVNIDTSQDIPRYQAEFLVKNSSIDEFLERKESVNFVEKVKQIWQPVPGGVKVTAVESKLDRKGRVPIPPQKEGVFIAVGGASTYEVLKQEYRGCAGLRDSSNSKFPPFDIDWCEFKLMDVVDSAVVVSNATTTVVSGEGYGESTYIAPVFDSSARDFGSDFLLILILPLAVVVIIAIILAIIMFCFREGRPKRDSETPRPQLSHHDSILRATFRLRQLSHQNGDAVPDSSDGVPQPKDTSTPYKQKPPPSQREYEPEPEPPMGAPPPYRLPPQPGVNMSAPNGNNQYYPGSAQDVSRHQRPPPFMNSGNVH